MKHLKIYENFEGTYEVNDYVILRDVSFLNKNNKWINLFEDRGETKGKIRNIEVVNDKKREISYLIILSDDFVWVNESYIRRKLTPEEIEQYKIQIETDKYNL